MPRGGKREGAGRKPTVKSTTNTLRKKTAEEILSKVDEETLWAGLLNSEDQKIRLESLKYLTDRRDGKPAQSTALTLNAAPNLDLGNLPLPAASIAGTTSKPN